MFVNIKSQYFFSFAEEAMNFLVEHILSLPSEALQPNEHTSLTSSITTSLDDSNFDVDEKRKSSLCCN